MTALEQAQALLREAERLVDAMPRADRIRFLIDVGDVKALLSVALTRGATA